MSSSTATDRPAAQTVVPEAPGGPWARSQASGQWALGQLMELFGIPFSAKKHVEGDDVITFLGVVTDFTASGADRVTMSVDEGRRGRLVQLMREAAEQGVLPSSRAAVVAGKLMFTLTWMASKVGRAAMQPIFACADREGDERGMRRRDAPSPNPSPPSSPSSSSSSSASSSPSSSSSAACRACHAESRARAVARSKPVGTPSSTHAFFTEPCFLTPSTCSHVSVIGSARSAAGNTQVK
eukprot:CAMPEP_0115850708 /NCGR_PEP_ID=MMETSP0287-20121206/12106_1 /TAXON_ID=412157 /ORGANISM="Chrysochromulina rotalis, Strain UIO044" /LENGTH=238 /DNA_ID=CAMNT_0003304719 /DNA_START=533 /DNA_END=1249 /DNA_ORIENTATION=+